MTPPPLSVDRDTRATSVARAIRWSLPVLLFLLFPNPLLAKDILYEVSVSKFLMGTSVETTARHSDINACRQALFLAYREMERVESLLSFHNPESEISKINNQAGVKPVAVSAESYDIIDRAKGHARELDGLFDVSIGAISERWGFNHDRETTLPDPEEIATLRLLVDFQQIILDPGDTTVFLRSPGMKIDLGGIAKGYAIDRGVAILRENGVQHFFLNAGGDIHVSGMREAGTSWRVGIRHPRKPDDLIASFDLRDYAVATSGDYERFKVFDGKRYHHILDPRTGYPGTRCQSVTVLAQTAEEADVLATYLFLEGVLSGSIDGPFWRSAGGRGQGARSRQRRAYLMVRADGAIVHRGFPEDANLWITELKAH